MRPRRKRSSTTCKCWRSHALTRVHHIEKLGEQHKISMVEDLRKTRTRVMKKVVQHIDSMEGNVFDSSHVIIAPRLQ